MCCKEQIYIYMYLHGYRYRVGKTGKLEIFMKTMVATQGSLNILVTGGGVSHCVPLGVYPFAGSVLGCVVACTDFLNSSYTSPDFTDFLRKLRSHNPMFVCLFLHFAPRTSKMGKEFMLRSTIYSTGLASVPLEALNVA